MDVGDNSGVRDDSFLQERLVSTSEGPPLNGSPTARTRDELVEEQAALRRVGKLVARGTVPERVFSAVVEEMGRLLRAETVLLIRYERGGTSTVLAGWSREGEHVAAGTRVPLTGHDVSALVLRTGRPARIDDYSVSPAPPLAREFGMHAAVGAPIVVDKRIWGAMIAASRHPVPIPHDTEARLAGFIELVAPAIASAQTRSNVDRLVEEQGALRRVAMLVARGAPPDVLFAAVSEEVGGLLGTDGTQMIRYDPNDEVTYVAGWSKGGGHIPVGTRSSLEGENVAGLVFHTGRPARIDDYANATGPIAALVREHDLRSVVGGPIVVDDKLWGAIMAFSRLPEPLSPDAEARIAKFSELVATAISNAQAQGELAASRARIVAAADETRRGIERDLHDGTQQRLVTLGLELRAAEAEVPPGEKALGKELAHVADGLTEVLEDLREISQGIHPAILSQGGIGPAMKALARRSAIPVNLDVRIDKRLPEPVEVTAYYVVSEALANAAKHAQASTARIEVDVAENVLQLAIRDDGVGGADSARGSGLIGLTDRVEALGGTLTVLSPIGQGTTMRVELPCARSNDHLRASS